MPVRLLARMVEHECRNEVKLKIGRVEIRATLQERAGFKALARRRPVAEQQVLQSSAHRIERFGLAVKRNRLRALVLHRAVQMVLQISADAFQVRNDGDIEAP